MPSRNFDLFIKVHADGSTAIGSLQRLGSTALGLGAAAVIGIGIASTAVIGLGVDAVQTSISVESAFAGVAKTTDGLTDSMGRLTEMGAEVKQEFRDLALQKPVKLEDLLEIGEMGGQLGVARENLTEFTSIIADISVATNLTSEQAANDFARLLNIYETGMDEFGDVLSRAAAANVDLGNKSAATESEILDFTLRIAGAGKVAGLSIPEIMGIGTAFSSVGIQAEAGGTAVQKVLLDIHMATITGSEKLQLYAETAGMSAEQFKVAWKTAPGEAFSQFVAGLGRAGDDAIAILSELEINDARQIRSFLSMAEAGNLLPEMMGVANTAFAENTALVDEATKRYQTTESQMLLLQNRFRDLSLTVGDSLKPAFLDVMTALFPVAQLLAENLPGALAIVVPLVESLAGFIERFFIALSEGKNPLDAIILAMGGLPGPVQEIIAKVGEVLGPIVEWIGKNVELNDVLIGLGVAIASVIIPALATVVSAAAPVIGIFLAVVATVAALRTAWETDFLGIRTMFTNVWENSLKPAFELIKEWFDRTMPPIIARLTEIWETKLQPAFSKLGDIVEKRLMPLLGDKFQIDLDNLGALLDVVAISVSALVDVISFLAEAFVVGVDAIEDMFAWLDKLDKQINALQLPPWLTPGSPTPFELGLRGIADALQEVSGVQLPKLGAELGGSGISGFGGNSGMGDNRTIINDRRVTVHANYKNQQSPTRIMDDLTLAQMLQG